MATASNGNNKKHQQPASTRQTNCTCGLAMTVTAKEEDSTEIQREREDEPTEEEDTTEQQENEVHPKKKTQQSKQREHEEEPTNTK